MSSPALVTNTSHQRDLRSSGSHCICIEPAGSCSWPRRLRLPIDKTSQGCRPIARVCLERAGHGRAAIRGSPSAGVVHVLWSMRA